MRKLVGSLAATAAILGFGGLAAQAETAPESVHYPNEEWQIRDHNGVEWTESAESTIVDPNTVALTKVATIGTSAENHDVGLTADENTKLTVDYTVDIGDDDIAALESSGAVRFFYYETAHPDTNTDAPTGSVHIDGAAGSLSLDVPGGTEVGTIGVTFDAGYAGAGTVTFTNLTFGDTDILFKKVEVEAAEPEFVDPTCENPDGADVVLPEVDNVTYTVSPEDYGPGVEVLVEATPADDAHEVVGTATWTHTFADLDCQDPDPDPTDDPDPEPDPTDDPKDPDPEPDPTDDPKDPGDDPDPKPGDDGDDSNDDDSNGEGGAKGGDDGSGDALPDTGSNLSGLIVLAGATLLTAGGAALWFQRRKVGLSAS